MTTYNRRLDEIKEEKKLFQQLLDEAETMSDCLTYGGKLDILKEEEKKIRKKM